jgi:hypothetical protein
MQIAPPGPKISIIRMRVQEVCEFEDVMRDQSTHEMAEHMQC